MSPAALPGAPGATVVLCRSLTPAQAAKLAPLCAANRRLQLTGRFERQRYPDRDLARRLGRVVRRDGIEVGVSGLERANDAILRGRPGMFRVMVDREGRWLPETWEKVREMRPGYDVYLPVRLAALTGGGDA
jgi:cell division protein FtsI/penicillin-binding protein 2